jgi:hypothetical protein
MTTLKTITLAAAFVASATSLALAQDGRAYGNGMPPSDYKGPGGMPSYPMEGSTAANAARSGGSGAHQSAQKTGSAENTQKVLGNQNGYAYNGMPPADYKGPGGMPSYPMEGRAARNAARSGGAGTHQNAQKTGSAENTQKVFGNQNGYAYNGMPPADYKGPGGMPSYAAERR